MRRRRWLVQNSGQALVEYALILALASLAIVSALMILQGSLGSTMQASGHQIDAAAGGRAGQPAGSETGAAGPAPGGDGGYGSGGSASHGKGNSGNGSGNDGPNGRK